MRRREPRSRARAPGAPGVGADRGENDQSVQRALPVARDAEEYERGADDGEQRDTEQRAGERPSTAAYGRAPQDHGGDHPHLEPDAGVARNLVESDVV